jgi:hypothetical protein
MKFIDIPDMERSPLLQVVTESRQYSSIADQMNTFFTPMDSPNLSDDEDIPRRQEGTRRLSRSSELFSSLTKLTPEKVRKIDFSSLFIYTNSLLILNGI